MLDVGSTDRTVRVHPWSVTRMMPGLYVTADGGQHWHAVPVPAPLSDLAVSGGRLYALGAACAEQVNQSCQTRVLYTASPDGSALHRVPGLPAGYRSVLAATPQVVDLLVPASDIGPATLWSRTGGSWTSSLTPCTWGGADFGAVASYSNSGVALVCGGQPGAGNQAGKAAYRSTDGGSHWTRTGVLPGSAGYLGTLAAPSATTLVLGENRGGVLVTHDSGAHWTAVPGTQGDGFWQVSQPQPGVVAAVTANGEGGRVAVSTDGGSHWTVTTIP